MSILKFKNIWEGKNKALGIGEVLNDVASKKNVLNRNSQVVDNFLLPKFGYVDVYAFSHAKFEIDSGYGQTYTDDIMDEIRLKGIVDHATKIYSDQGINWIKFRVGKTINKKHDKLEMKKGVLKLIQTSKEIEEIKTEIAAEATLAQLPDSDSVDVATMAYGDAQSAVIATTAKNLDESNVENYLNDYFSDGAIPIENSVAILYPNHTAVGGSTGSFLCSFVKSLSSSFVLPSVEDVGYYLAHEVLHQYLARLGYLLYGDAQYFEPEALSHFESWKKNSSVKIPNLNMSGHTALAYWNTSRRKELRNIILPHRIFLKKAIEYFYLKEPKLESFINETEGYTYNKLGELQDGYENSYGSYSTYNNDPNVKKDLEAFKKRIHVRIAEITRNASFGDITKSNRFLPHYDEKYWKEIDRGEREIESFS